MFENPWEAGKQEILQQMFPKILDLKSSSEQIFSKNWRWVPLNGKCKCLTYALVGWLESEWRSSRFKAKGA